MAAARATTLARWLALVALTALFAAALELLRISAGLLLGAMAAAILLSTREAGVRVPSILFKAAQAVIGCMVARVMAPSIFHEMLRQWPIFLVAIVWVLIAACVLGVALTRWRVLPGTVALWGSFPGAAMTMVLMAEDYGADIRLVAFMQYLRVVIVALLASVVARLSTGAIAPAQSGHWAEVAWSSFGLTVAAALCGLAFGRLARLPAAALIGPMVLATLMQDAGALAIELPAPLLMAAYVVVGWAIGLRFNREILRHAAAALPRVTASILVLVAACGLMAAALVAFAGIDPLTAYLATSPGGADSVAIIAASSSKVDMPFVMAMQISRFLLILVAGPSLARFLAGRLGAVAAGAREH